MATGSPAPAGMTLVKAATAMVTTGGMVTTTEALEVQAAGQEETEAGIAIAALVDMADSTPSLHSNHLSHPQDHRLRSAGAIGETGIDSNSPHSLPHGHGQGTERQIGGTKGLGMSDPAMLRGTKRAGVER